jgi:hypothetical protein
MPRIGEISSPMVRRQNALTFSGSGLYSPNELFSGKFPDCEACLAAGEMG